MKSSYELLKEIILKQRSIIECADDLDKCVGCKQTERRIELLTWVLDD